MIQKQYAAVPTTPWTFYRWSMLAHLTPYLEETNAYRALDLTVPLYGPSLTVLPQNAQRRCTRRANFSLSE